MKIDKRLRALLTYSFTEDLVRVLGDLNKYANPAEVWRYMGVGVKIGTGTYRYNPQRRCVLWYAVKTLLQHRTRYGKIERERHTRELQRTTPGSAKARAFKAVSKEFLADIWRLRTGQ